MSSRPSIKQCLRNESTSKPMLSPLARTIFWLGKSISSSLASSASCMSTRTWSACQAPRGRGTCNDLSLGEDDGEHAVLEAVVEEDVGKAVHGRQTVKHKWLGAS
eukprot:682998-Hanusia_phi.AAC.3